MRRRKPRAETDRSPKMLQSSSRVSFLHEGRAAVVLCQRRVGLEPDRIFVLYRLAILRNRGFVLLVVVKCESSFQVLHRLILLALVV